MHSSSATKHDLRRAEPPTLPSGKAARWVLGFALAEAACLLAFFVRAF